MKANVNVILMVAQVIWSPWDLLRSSNVLWTISFAINTVSDGDNSTLASLMKKKPYGEDREMVKEDCIGHIQK